MPPFTPTWKNVAAPNFGSTIVGLNQASRQITDSFGQLGSVFDDYAKRRQSLATNDAIKNLMSAAPEERDDLLKGYDADSWVDSATIFDTVSKMEQQERLAAAAERSETEFGWKQTDREQETAAKTLLGTVLPGGISEEEILSAPAELRPMLLEQQREGEKIKLDTRKTESTIATNEFNLAAKQYDIAEKKRLDNINAMVRAGSSIDEARAANPSTPFNYSPRSGSTGQPMVAGGASAAPSQAVNQNQVPGPSPEQIIRETAAGGSVAPVPAQGRNEQIVRQQVAEMDAMYPEEIAQNIPQFEAAIDQARERDQIENLMVSGAQTYADAQDPALTKGNKKLLETRGMNQIKQSAIAQAEFIVPQVIGTTASIRQEVNTTGEISAGTQKDIENAEQNLAEFDRQLSESLIATGLPPSDQVAMKKQIRDEMGLTEELEKFEKVKENIFDTQDKIAGEQRDKKVAAQDAVKQDYRSDTADKVFRDKMTDDGYVKASKTARMVANQFTPPAPIELVKKVMAEKGYFDTGGINNYKMYSIEGAEGDELAAYIAMAMLDKVEEVERETGAGNAGKLSKFRSQLGVNGVADYRKAFEAEIKAAEARANTNAITETYNKNAGERESVQPDSPVLLDPRAEAFRKSLQNNPRAYSIPRR